MTMKKQILLMVVVGLFHVLPSAAEEALVSGYHLRPAEATAYVGESVDLKLVYCSVENKVAAADTLKPDNGQASSSYLLCEGDIGGEALILPASPIDVEWKVDGAGSVSGDEKNATYHAPASKPTPNTVTVAATFSYSSQSSGNSYSDAKQTLQSSITILDRDRSYNADESSNVVKNYTGTFSKNDVTVNNEYTTNVSGKIRWEFDEYYEMGNWWEYTGSGTATLKVNRTGCGDGATFENVPVEGRLKVYDDKRYEFLINLVGDSEQTRTCRRPDLDKDLKWEETFSAGGDAVSSGDPCAVSEFYPRYAEKTRLEFEREGTCSQMIVNKFQQAWSFQAAE